MNESQIFAGALRCMSPNDRRTYLDDACSGDPQLRNGIEALLRAIEADPEFLETPAELPPTPDPPAETRPLDGFAAWPGAVLAGRYKLLQRIGEGGMGAVWMAEQFEPVRREVAVKIIKPGSNSRQVIARFEAERQALAMMDHPNIAKVLDAGVTDAGGTPYFVMELIKGVPITRYCKTYRLSLRERLGLFVPVCHAVQHAHQKGVIHRDLKPSNILVAPGDGGPVPKVIDFGVAKAAGSKLTERTMFTEFGQVIGTLEYMSPEQAELNNQDIDTRSDGYSLGVVLYELLTGTTPLDRRNLAEAPLDELLRVIREGETVRPSTRLSTAVRPPAVNSQKEAGTGDLARMVRGDLDWIVMKCLEKDRDRRYETANGLAADIRRYLADEPVLAGPPSAGYRLRKFARRNRHALATAAVLAVLLLAGVAVVTAMVVSAARDRVARAAATTTEVDSALADAGRLFGDGRLPEALAMVRRAEAALASGEGGSGLAGGVAGMRADLEMVERLEVIRLEQAAGREMDFSIAEADARYAVAFRDYGIDVEASDPAEAAARISRSEIPLDLAAALDNWALARRSAGGSGPDWQGLLAVAREADPDPLRTELRLALVEGVDDSEVGRILAAADGAVRPVSLLLAAYAFGESGRPDRAAEVLRAARRKFPRDFWVNHELGRYMGLSRPPQWGEAVRFYTVAVALRPGSSGARVSLGMALHEIGELDEAIREYREALRLTPGSLTAMNNLGSCLREKGVLEEAESLLREAVRRRPDFAEALANLGTVLKDRGRLDEAAACYDTALKHRPAFSDGHSGLGVVRVLQGRSEDAIRLYEKAIALDPGNAEAHANLGMARKEQGRLDEAVALYETAIRLKPRLANAHYNLGNARRDQGRDDEAIARYREAVRLKPDYASAWYNLGNALRAQGEPGEAEAAYREVIRFEPGHAKALCNLGFALQDQGKFAEALREFEHGHALGIRTPGWKYPSAQWVEECGRLASGGNRNGS